MTRNLASSHQANLSCRCNDTSYPCAFISALHVPRLVWRLDRGPEVVFGSGTESEEQSLPDLHHHKGSKQV